MGKHKILSTGPPPYKAIIKTVLLGIAEVGLKAHDTIIPLYTQPVISNTELLTLKWKSEQLL